MTAARNRMKERLVDAPKKLGRPRRATLAGFVCKGCQVELVGGENTTISQLQASQYKCSACRKIEYHSDPERRRIKNSTPERRRISNDKYRRANLHKIAEKNNMRNALKRSRIPADADRTAIRSIYEVCGNVTRVLNTPYNVDHIDSLANGGLHHQDNLIIMRADWNRSKYSASWPWLRWFNEPVKAGGE